MREEKDIATHDTRVRSHILYGPMLCAVVTSFSFSAYSLLLPAFLQEFQWARSAAVLPFSLAMVVWGVMQPLTGALADRRGTRPLILGGILCSTLGGSVLDVEMTILDKQSKGVPIDE